MSYIFIYTKSIIKLVKDTFNLNEHEPVRVDFMSSYPRQDGTTEYEFKALFKDKNEWHDNGVVERFITVSIRDNY